MTSTKRVGVTHMAQLLFMVPVPEVEPYVAQLRARHDPSAQRGLPAHVTVLHAPLPSGGIDASVISRASAAMTPMAPFNYQVARVGRFPGTLYLAAEPAAPFVRLHDQLVAALLDGEFNKPERRPLVPHVSVVRKSEIDDHGIEAELTAVLDRVGPIACYCREICLLENSSGLWRRIQEFALSGGTGTPAPAPS
jgi:2'-5' RNA ligase